MVLIHKKGRFSGFGSLGMVLIHKKGRFSGCCSLEMGVRARKWCVRPQKGGDLRTKSSGSRFYPQNEGILRTVFVERGAYP